MIYTLCMVLILIGLYGVVSRKNMVKIVMCFFIIEYGINLFLILLGYRGKGIPPVVENGGGAAAAGRMVDPLPQAVVSTLIVIGLSLMLLLVAVAIKVYEKYGTFDITKINNLKG